MSSSPRSGDRFGDEASAAVRVPGARSRRRQVGPVVGLVVEQLRQEVPGGIGTYVLGLLAGLGQMAGELDVEVRLVATAPRSGPGEDRLAETPFPLDAVHLPHRLAAAAWSRGLCPVRGVDLLHATSLLQPPGGAGSVVTVHDLAWRTHPDAFPRRGRRWHDAALRRALGRASAFVVPSPATEAALVECGGPADRIVVIEHGADHLPPPDATAAAEVLKAMGVVDRFFLAVGTREPRKNLPRLLRAYGEARRRLVELGERLVDLVVVGPPGWGPELEVPEGVHVAGALPAPVLAELYRRALAVAYVPLLEGYGLPVTEAMAAGAPVVASPVPASRGAALEVDPTSTRAIAEALEAVVVDPVLRARLIGQGRDRTAGLTWRRAAEAHVALWRALRPAGGERPAPSRDERQPGGSPPSGRSVKGVGA